MSADGLLTIAAATVACRHEILFSDLDFEIRQNEHWALVGESGSGKSALLQAIYGRYAVTAGKIAYHFYDAHIKTHQRSDPLFSPRRLMAHVDLRHDFRLRPGAGDLYYQQRYNAGFSDDAPTVEDYLGESADAETETGIYAGPWTIPRVNALFELDALMGKHLIKLSSGEGKRVRLAAALLKNPRLLLLDHPLAGLDIVFREKFDVVFSDIADSGITVVMATRPDELPKIITHVAVLDRNRRMQVFPRWSFSSEKIPNSGFRVPDAEKLRRLGSMDSDRKRFDILVSMRGVRVAYGPYTVFDGLDWTVRRGERWAVEGPNGAGKSTLLALINGDHPQAYANDMVVFDRPRGTGESIWDIKRHIGFMSPELFQCFPARLTCFETVISGFYDVLGRPGTGRISENQRKTAEEWLDVMNLGPFRDTPLSAVPDGLRRLCLLARALVKSPSLLLLDEPCQGLDRFRQKGFRDLIDALAASEDFALVYVTHYREELPACIHQRLVLGSKGSGN